MNEIVPKTSRRNTIIFFKTNQQHLYLIKEKHGGAGGVVINNVISRGLLTGQSQHRLMLCN